MVGRWRERFHDERLHGPSDRQRAGRPQAVPRSFLRRALGDRSLFERRTVPSWSGGAESSATVGLAAAKRLDQLVVITGDERELIGVGALGRFVGQPGLFEPPR